MMTHLLNISEIARLITPFPSLLATRFTGRRFWEQLQMHLHNLEDGIAVLSFTGVDVMDASFADEVFATLARCRARKEEVFCPVILTDLNETCIDNLKMALETRPDREPSDLERLRNCVLPVLTGEEMSLIGKFEEHVLQSFNLLGRYKTLTARDLADVLTLNLNAASTRLKTLADLGLAWRTEMRDAQGKQYIYHSLQ
jgi:hypothetical protein